MKKPEPSRRISVLREDVSRKIAAGEVIDRPLSIVRELLDNALDAGAGAIDVHLRSGGLDGVRVVDDGAGMDRDDLGRCWLPHATSKIETEEDLLRVTSLGFRGEALSSMATASRLEIVSCPSGGVAHRLVVRGGRQEALEPCQGRPGTVVDVSELFFNYPARKKFLRSPSAEAGLCRSIFLDRAAAFPVRRVPPVRGRRAAPVAAGRGSRPAASRSATTSNRACSAPPRRGARGSRCGWSRPRRTAGATIGGWCRSSSTAGACRSSRSCRPWSSASRDTCPGGFHPVAFVFVDIDPSLVDFNIHPAKKEVRFRNLPEVHRAVVSATRTFLAGRQSVTVFRDEPPAGLPFDADRRASAPPAAWPLPAPPPSVAAPSAGDNLRYLGQAFGVFLVCELPDRLLLVDQHAAHERIVYERLRRQRPAVQDLLFPLAFDASADEDARLAGAGGCAGGDRHRGAPFGHADLGGDGSRRGARAAARRRARGSTAHGLRERDGVAGRGAAHGRVPARAQGRRPGGSP